jgi:hypothetical protein
MNNKYIRGRVQQSRSCGVMMWWWDRESGGWVVMWLVFLVLRVGLKYLKEFCGRFRLTDLHLYSTAETKENTVYSKHRRSRTAELLPVFGWWKWNVLTTVPAKNFPLVPTGCHHSNLTDCQSEFSSFHQPQSPPHIVEKNFEKFLLYEQGPSNTYWAPHFRHYEFGGQADCCSAARWRVISDKNPIALPYEEENLLFEIHTKDRTIDWPDLTKARIQSDVCRYVIS